MKDYHEHFDDLDYRADERYRPNKKKKYINMDDLDNLLDLEDQLEGLLKEDEEDV